MTDPAPRHRRAAKAAYLGGALLLLTGSSGAVALLRLGWSALNEHAPRMGELLAPFFFVAWLAAVFGGATVIAGGIAYRHRKRILAKLLIGFGAGVGVIPFVLGLVFVWATGGDPIRFLFSLAVTVQGLGLLLALYAQATG